MRPIGIDLFSGAGGLSLGFEQAGFDIVAAVEADPVHCAVHKYNFPQTAIVPHRIEEVTGKQLLRLIGNGTTSVDCVFGGAPCQGFSLIGQRALDDPRNRLVREFVRMVVELDAKAFVFENVKGLTVGKHRALLNEVIEEFSGLGYDVRVPWQILNAGNFGIPQNRERLILLGAKSGEDIPDYPLKRSNIAGKESRIEGLPVGPTCADALDDLPDAEEFQSLISSDAVDTPKFGVPSVYSAQLRCLTNDAWHFGYVREWKPALLTSSVRTKHTSISRKRFRNTKPGTVEPISRFLKLCSDGVANTLRAGTDGSRGAFSSPRPIHYKFDRCITVREMARLHGFPDWFRFNRTKWHGARQIGNAVPPPLARAIAERVIETLGISPSRPNTPIPLGDTELLSFDISKAARHFGVNPMPSRRDKHSGARKRKQVDIEHEVVVG